MKKKILIVDDEEDLCEILQFNLESERYDVDVAHSAEAALEMNLGGYNLILLDVMMGGMSGFKLANKMRKKLQLQTPIIFLTAKNTENDTLTGFNLGADDYIPKPFSIKEVIARVKAVLSRSAYHPNTDRTLSSIIEYEDLQIDLNQKMITLSGKKMSLPKKEFEILVLFFQNPGRIFSREEILSRVWDTDVIVISRTIDVNITRLRKKLGVMGKRIKSRSGYGYYFDKS